MAKKNVKLIYTNMVKVIQWDPVESTGKECEKCVITEEVCPYCGRFMNRSYLRLVKDNCGHTKCRMCLLNEDHGCKLCEVMGEEPKSIKEDPSDTIKLTNEENILPLELVINKDSKCKENNLDLTPTKCKSDLNNENVTINYIEEVCESATNDSNNDSNKAYIPKIETNDMMLDIHIHSKDSSKDPENLQNPNGSQIEEKIDNKIIKEKRIKCRDRSHITILPGNPERYKCTVCCKIFRNKKGKCYHDACVTGIKPYQCAFCDKTFVKRSHFEYHERVHRGYKPHKCNLCEKSFPQQNKLNRHMLSHSKEKRFVCPECKKRYSKPDDLRNHLNTHNASSTYDCKSCNKTFRLLTNLKRHMRTHMSERPYACDQCSKSFKDRSLLMRHKRTHGKERPFSCHSCNRVFLSKSELLRHSSVHSDEKPFSCEYCCTMFRRKDNLKRHIRHHHTEMDSSSEMNKMPVAETTTNSIDRSYSAKSNHQRQKQKSRRTQPKSPSKIITTIANSRDQINSRLDSMGNITPVIKTTSEVSNAVPVINGPINIRRLEDKTDKKIFMYTEPIPIAKAVVLNCRIEEKLYPQSASSHNYFVRTYLKDKNSKVNSYPNNKLALQENCAMMSSSQIEPSLSTTGNKKNPATKINEEKTTKYEKEKDKQDEDETKEKYRKTDETERSSNKYKKNLAASLQVSNCVSTITKHTTQQYKEHSSENSGNDDNSNVTNLDIAEGVLR